MNLDLLERIFQDSETEFEEAEVVAIAFLFLKNAQEIKADLGEDYWIQIGRSWDLNVFSGKVYGDEDITKMTLYRITKEGKTDTLNDGISLI